MSDINQLMSRLNIASVFWVDDENASSDELDTDMLISHVVDNLVYSDKDIAKKSIETVLKKNNSTTEFGKFRAIIAADENEDSKKTRLEDIFTKFSNNYNGNIKKLLQEIIAELPRALSPEEKGILYEIFKSDDFPWQMHSKSFSEWNKNHNDILSQTDPNKSYLFIVDLQNKTESSPIDGKSVISQIWQKAPNSDNFYILVLTSQCKQKDELSDARELTNELTGNQIKTKIPLFMVSKSRFSDDTDTKSESIRNSFLDVLGRMKLSILHISLSEALKDQMKLSIDTAFNMVEQLTIEELLLAVTLNSNAEGISEIDTLIRLINIAQRQALSQKIISDKLVRNILLEMRGIEHGLNASQIRENKALINFRSSELYDDGRVINSLFSPLKPGDIFEFENKEQQKNYYVLVANSCDLILRGSTGKRKLEFGFLLPIQKQKNKDSNEPNFELPHAFFELENKKTDIGGSLILNQFAAIPLEVLDLCWTNSEGICKWVRNSGVSQTLELIGAQTKRWAIINQFYSSIESEDGLKMCVKQSIIDFKYKRRIKRNGEVKTLNSIDFNIRRVARLSSSHASQLVIRFSGVIGRPSAEYDYAKPLQ